MISFVMWKLVVVVDTGVKEACMPARKRIIIVSTGSDLAETFRQCFLGDLTPATFGEGRWHQPALSPGRATRQGAGGIYTFFSSERKPGEGRTDAAARAELMLPPPLDIGRLMRFCLSLEEAAGAKVVGIIGFREDGALLTVDVRRSVSLLEVISRMLGVAQSWEEPVPDSGDGGLNPRPDGEPFLPPVDQLNCLRLREETGPEQFGSGP